MTVETTIDWTEIDVEREYFLGLIDHLAQPKLEPEPSKTGYRLNPQVSFTVRKSELLAGILTEVFSELDLSWKVSYSGDDPKRILVREQESIERLWDIGEGIYLQIAEKLAYIVDYIEEYKGRNIAGQPELFLKVFKPWSELHPEWEGRVSRKYTLDFFKNEFGIPSVSEENSIPSVPYPDGMSLPYTAGLIDAKGWANLSVQKSSDYSIGFSLSPKLYIPIRRPPLHMKAHLKKFFADHGLSPSYSDGDESFQATFSSADGVESLIELVGPKLYYLYELCELFYGQLLPAYRDGYHHSKEGFLDMLRAYRDVAPSTNSRKYDLEYFKSEWEMD